MSVWRVTYINGSVTLLKATEKRAAELAAAPLVVLVDRVKVLA